jgi:hypothetical protein
VLDLRGPRGPALKPDRIPFWPYGTPQQQRTCVTIRLSSEARPLLMRNQTDILPMLAGEEGQGSGRITGGRAGRRVRPRGPWARSLRASNVFAVLRKLVFVMLGPLWEDTSQVTAVRTEGGGRWMLPPDWAPGPLPPEIAAPALLAATTFLAAESGTRLAGITWNPQFLIAGEDDAIKAETLLWHLNGFNARLVQDLFGEPFARPFALLLTALRADRQGLGGAGPRFPAGIAGGMASGGAAREAARRRLGAGRARLREPYKAACG